MLLYRGKFYEYYSLYEDFARIYGLLSQDEGEWFGTGAYLEPPLLEILEINDCKIYECIYEVQYDPPKNTDTTPYGFFEYRDERAGYSDVLFYVVARDLNEAYDIAGGVSKVKLLPLIRQEFSLTTEKEEQWIYIEDEYSVSDISDKIPFRVGKASYYDLIGPHCSKAVVDANEVKRFREYLEDTPVVIANAFSSETNSEYLEGV